MAEKNNQKSHNTPKIIGIILLIVMWLAGVTVIVGYISYMQNPPETVQTMYGGELTYAEPDDNGDAIYAININIFTNENDNGLECAEFQWNYYTDANIPENEDDYKNVYSSGYQSLNGMDYDDYYRSIGWWKYTNSITLNSGYYYNSTDGLSYVAIDALTPDDSWILDYGNGLAKIDQKQAVYYETVAVLQHYISYDINRAIVDLYNCATSLADGDYILQFNLSDYFSYKIYNEETKQFVIDTSATTEEYLYLDIKIHISSNGLVDASQSLFGMIAKDTDYSYEGISVQDYYTTKTVYTVTENDFTTVTVDGVALATLNSDCIAYLNNFYDIYLIVDINLDVVDFEGFAPDAFSDYGGTVNALVLSASADSVFLVYDNYSNTTLTNVTLQHEGGGI